ncbi:RNA-binding domain-containing protein [Arcicella rosea]|uniref:ATP-dependent DNA helicase RecG n=1 Tax=Arcicella rosea TaxID=502909 RepID=A0A841EUS3_9BACT|nr:RNA-binding domain-containing protein [Arcicella rosea]MBB6005129.1 ATP-dependent DNA helicase RecG [Arcicella rosea]
MQEKDLHSLLEELLQQNSGEQAWLEFKSNVASQKASITIEGIGEYISALANGATISNQDFGYLILGVEDITKNIIGTNFRPFVQKVGNQDFELWLRLMVSPKISFEIFEFEYQNQHLVLFRIPAAKGEPVSFQKKFFIRINSQKTDLLNYPAYVRQVYNSLEDWSAKTIPNASIADLDEMALAVARAKFKEKNTQEAFYSEIDNWDTSVFLDKAKITIHGKITNTAILLLGKPESVHLLSPSIAEITWKLDTEEKAYEHFGTPLLLNTTKVLQKIRNYQYKFFPNNELLSVTVNKYETRVILEAMHNAIAHQDYTLNARIIVTEKTDKLVFSNIGGFYSGTPEEYFFGEKTPDRYRNPWLVKAMVNLGMIDTMGYGIYTMLKEQRKRFFPLPDYHHSDSRNVVLEIYGHEIDTNYSKLLMEHKDLSLETVILLDRVQKKLPITKEASDSLRKQKLIEGRTPNYFVSASIAQATGQKAIYSKNKAFEKSYYLDLIIKSITEHGFLERSDVDELLWNKLPEWMDEKQKKIKITNLLAELRSIGKIRNEGSDTKPKWVLL